jgi:hypothetical protein
MADSNDEQRRRRRRSGVDNSRRGGAPTTRLAGASAVFIFGVVALTGSTTTQPARRQRQRRPRRRPRRSRKMTVTATATTDPSTRRSSTSRLWPSGQPSGDDGVGWAGSTGRVIVDGTATSIDVCTTSAMFLARLDDVVWPSGHAAPHDDGDGGLTHNARTTSSTSALAQWPGRPVTTTALGWRPHDDGEADHDGPTRTTSSTSSGWVSLTNR